MAGFKKSVLVSFLGHVFIFGAFSFSFGPKMPSTSDYGRINFFSGVLRNYDMLSHGIRKSIPLRNPVSDNRMIPASKEYGDTSFVSQDVYLKPHQSLSFREIKEPTLGYMACTPPLAKKDRPVVMLYPRLPYQFNLYFKDRQVAHVELMYNITRHDNHNAIIIIRKVSSGNLEADLICMRYINNYLSAQQEKVHVTDAWKAVKIELSAKND